MSLTKATYSMIDGASVNILDYGADPTGVADSTIAIQAAINAAASNPRARGVVFPAGDFKVSNKITIPGPNWDRFVLQGMGESLIRSTHDGIVFEDSSSNCVITNLTFQGPGKTFTNSVAFKGRFIQGGIEFCRIAGFGVALDISNAVMSSIRRCNIRSSGTAIKATGGFQNLINISDCYIDFCDLGIDSNQWWFSTISNTALEYCGKSGQFAGGKTITFNNVWTEQETTGESFTIQNTSGLTIENCRFVTYQPIITFTGGWGSLPKEYYKLESSGVYKTSDFTMYYNGTEFVNSIEKKGTSTGSVITGDGRTVTEVLNGTTPATPFYKFEQNSINDVTFFDFRNTQFFPSGNLNLWEASGYSSGGNRRIAKYTVDNIGQHILAAGSLSQAARDVLTVGWASIAPALDNTLSNGTASMRWSVVYAGTGTINTSDGRAKQQVTDLDAAERQVATAIKRLIKTFKFNDAVEAKGDKARIHVGVIAQDVEQAFADAGLDASRYALFCKDVWHTYKGDVVEVDTQGKYVAVHWVVNGTPVAPDEKGNYPQDATRIETKHDTEQHERLGIRYDQLLAFMIAAL